MNQEEKRIRIAKAAGWQQRKDGGRDKGIDPEGKSSVWPDYFNDLNAMHEVWELHIRGNDETEDRFSGKLLEAIGSNDPFDGSRPNGSDAEWALASNATAAQRAEAFGLTFGLWRRGKKK